MRFGPRVRFATSAWKIKVGAWLICPYLRSLKYLCAIYMPTRHEGTSLESPWKTWKLRHRRSRDFPNSIGKCIAAICCCSSLGTKSERSEKFQSVSFHLKIGLIWKKVPRLESSSENTRFRSWRQVLAAPELPKLIKSDKNSKNSIAERFTRPLNRLETTCRAPQFVTANPKKEERREI